MKFKIEAAGNMPSETTGLFRIDGDSMHNKNYMVVDLDKPYGPEVYAVLKKNGIVIPEFDAVLGERKREKEKQTIEIGKKLLEELKQFPVRIHEGRLCYWVPIRPSTEGLIDSIRGICHGLGTSWSYVMPNFYVDALALARGVGYKDLVIATSI